MDRIVKVRVLKNFDTYAFHDLVFAQMTERLASLIANHYLELLEDPLWRALGSIEPPSE